LGAALISAGDAQGAVAELQSAIRQGYATVGARCALAAAFERSGSPDEAQAVLSAVVAKDPRAVDAWLQLAELLQRRGRREEAAVCYRRAYEQLKVERASNDPYLRVVHAQVLVSEGDSTTAIRELEAVLGQTSLPPDVAELARRVLRTARP
jgi:Tfp pilus assembly protein PilF